MLATMVWVAGLKLVASGIPASFTNGGVLPKFCPVMVRVLVLVSRVAEPMVTSIGALARAAEVNRAATLKLARIQLVRFIFPPLQVALAKRRATACERSCGVTP
jgi:hypothetical protein